MLSRLLLLIVLLLTFGCVQAEPPDYALVIERITTQGDVLVESYTPEHGQETAAAFTDIYFKVFEASGAEMALGAYAADQLKQLESDFGAVVNTAMAAESKSLLVARWGKLRSLLVITGRDLSNQNASFTSIMLQSLLILLREGFEAMLVISALVAYLRRIGARDKAPYLYGGAFAGLLASALTAYLLVTLLQKAGIGRAVYEGFTLLLASVVLFYLSYWLFSKREAAKWQGYIQGQMRKALDGGGMFALAFVAFLAVYREGAETILFYNALNVSHHGQFTAIALGILLAALALVLMYFALYHASIRIPFGTFFGVTAAMLYGLAIIFAGQAMLELQGAGIVPASTRDYLPTVPWLGLFPTIQGATLQVMFLCLLTPFVWKYLRKS